MNKNQFSFSDMMQFGMFLIALLGLILAITQ